MNPQTGATRVPGAGRQPAGSRRRAGDSRSVMPLAAAGCTRATVRAGGRRREARAQRAAGDAGEGARAERGIPSTRGSPARGDSVPVLCTHRPSLSEMGARGKRGSARAAAPRLDKSRNKVSVGEPAEGSLRAERCARCAGRKEESRRGRRQGTPGLSGRGRARRARKGAQRRARLARADDARGGTRGT